MKAIINIPFKLKREFVNNIEIKFPFNHPEIKKRLTNQQYNYSQYNHKTLKLLNKIIQMLKLLNNLHNQ